MNQLLFRYLPEVEGEEMFYLDDLLKNSTEEQIREFSFVYRSRRRAPMVILVTTLIGFAGFAGIQRFLTDQIGMGILYLFTAGLCFIGTIVDLINYQNIAFTYNRRIAYETWSMIKR